jgi:hypothetical protein
MSFPNYRISEESPQFDIHECGIKALFTGGMRVGRAKADEQLPLYGGYVLNHDDLLVIGTNPLARITMTLSHDEWGTTFSRHVITDSLLNTGRADEAPPKFLGGYFNVDILSYCRSSNRTGWYTAFLQLGPHCSQVLRFEMRPQHSIQDVVPESVVDSWKKDA